MEIVIILLGILAVIVIAVVVPSSKKGKRKCPQCAEWVKNEALKCRFCAFDFAAASHEQPASQARK
jgi:hypothetical protein